MKLPRFLSSRSPPPSPPRLASLSPSRPLHSVSTKSTLSPERNATTAQPSKPSPASTPEWLSSPTSPSLYGKRSRTSSFETSSASLLRELELVFRQFDANGDGKLAAAELGAVLRSLGDRTSDDEALLMVKEVDANGDGFVDLQEFINWNVKSLDMTGLPGHEELRSAFHMFDLDRNGFITVDELHGMLKRLGDETCTIEECRRMIRGVDRNGDGFVDFEEFKGMMMATESFCGPLRFPTPF